VTADAAVSLNPPKGERIAVNGAPIRFRLFQLVAFSVIIGACGAAAVAGAYFSILQVDWHVHLLALHFRLFYLKNWWDGGMGFIHSANWELYRHGYRDLGEPIIAVIAVRTLLAKPRTWRYRVGPVRLIVTPLILLAVAGALITGGIWLVDFALPNLWHRLFGGYMLTAPGQAQIILAHSSWEILLLGFAIGFVIHAIWAPAGATLQGEFVDRSVDRSRLAGDTVPLWVRYPLAPVQLRERWAWMMDHDTETRERGRIPRWLLITVTVIVMYLVVTGFIGHYWVGAGHSFPYLAP
jgi:hypothetical protein